MRGRAYNRHMSWTKAIRKKRISDSWMWGTNHPWYDNLHQYSKNKIHCSCTMCRAKTNSKIEKASGVGHFCLYTYIAEDGTEQKNWISHTWGRSYSGYKKNWKPSDLRKIQAMDARIKEYYDTI